jgi:hypothetical protein
MTRSATEAGNMPRCQHVRAGSLMPLMGATASWRRIGYCLGCEGAAALAAQVHSFALRRLRREAEW